MAVTFPQSDLSLEKLRKTFKTIFYHPDEVVPPEEARQAEVWQTRHTGLPQDLTFEDLAKTKIIQLTSGMLQSGRGCDADAV